MWLHSPARLVHVWYWAELLNIPLFCAKALLFSCGILTCTCGHNGTEVLGSAGEQT